ncbi:MAG: DUF2157 domain-containing protein [Deltaproteobacteria bacterium]|nr:MAG: DUF2157 domain-containing protein [Deltaproteobacteria bacterium]
MSNPADPLSRPATLDRLDRLRSAQVLDIQGHREAVRRVTATPSTEGWARLLDPAALALGALLLVASALYLVGWSWFDLPHAVRIGLSCLPLGVAGGVALWLGASRLAGQISAIAAGFLGLLPLLIVGLAFPSTASGELLFAYWALSMLPWTLGARSPFAWLAQAIAAEVALLSVLPRLLASVDGAFESTLDLSLAAHVALFTVFFLLGAILSHREDRSAPRWLPEVLSIPPLVALTIWLSSIVISFDPGIWLLRGGAVLVFFALLAVQVFFWLGRVRLLPATVHALSVLVVAMTILGRLLVEIFDRSDLGVDLFAGMVFSLLGIGGLVAVTVWLHLGWRRNARRVEPS